MATVLIAVPACHFTSRNTFCATTRARLDAALRRETELASEGHQVIFVVSGAVSYQPGPPKLHELMRSYLMEHREPFHLIRLGAGIGVADDSRNVMSELAPAVQAFRVVLVSSDWYLWAAMPFWRTFSRWSGITLETVSVGGTGGWRTWILYVGYGLVNRLMLGLGLRRVLERLLIKMQRGRTQGFTWDGCA